MRQFKIYLAILLSFFLYANSAISQDLKTAEVKIKTSANCDMCKKTIEEHLVFEKGIKKSDLDVTTKVVSVKYNPKKTSPEKIRLAISQIGYDADSIKANSKAYDKLDDCCKKGSCTH